MSKLSNWFLVFVIAAACTCGARTDCGNQAQISLLTSVHDDGSCRRASTRGVLLYEASQLLLEQYNSKTNGFKLELTVFDTCGSISGALKASMKALVAADVGCLQPPHYLGIIGPDNPTTAEAVQKVTSVLRVPHIVRRPATSAFLHHLAMENDAYIVRGIIKMIELLKWKSFTLVAPPDDNGDDDVQNIAKKLTIEAIAKNLCVIIHDNEDDEFTANIVHIGKPEDSFFTGPVNATVLVVSEGSLEHQLSHVNSSNTIVLLEDDRNELTDLQARVEKSKWWSAGTGKFDPEELREVRWLQDAIESYGVALDSICKRKKCKGQVNGADWNEMISKVLSSRNLQTSGEPRSLNIFSGIKEGELEVLGKIVVKENVAKISWKGQEEGTKKETEDDDEDEDEDEDEDALPETLRKISERSKSIDESAIGCVADLHEAKLTKDAEDHATHVVVSEMDDTEWWTMVGTVSGVGVAMFVVGILAVYVVYTNIRGPRSPKGQSSTTRRYSVEHDTSLRRVGSDREMPATGTGGRSQRSAPQRSQHSAHRRDSIRSNMSDRSV